MAKPVKNDFTADLADLIFELGQLKQIKHQGWYIIGIQDPESVGEHGLRAAQIAYFLAKRENHPNPFEVVTAVVFHDMGECRITDLHLISQRYVERDEQRAVSDQLDRVPQEKEEVFDLWNQFEQRTTQTGILARDADLLEQAFTAQEYIDRGNPEAQDWIDGISQMVGTKTAKELIQTIKKRRSQMWWKGLKKR